MDDREGDQQEREQGAVADDFTQKSIGKLAAISATTTRIKAWLANGVRNRG